jgi:predicted component of type VI protein secretion system
MMGVLVVVAGPAAGRRIDLTGSVTVGRREGEVVIEDPEISRRHCTIAPGPHDEVVVTDLGSTNGTWINGARIAGPTVVRPGDELRLGDCVCRLEVPHAAPAPPPPAAPAPVVPPHAAQPVGSAPPQQPFGAFAPAPAVAAPVAPRRRGAATRLPAGIVFAWAVIALDALALIVYFAAR